MVCRNGIAGKDIERGESLYASFATSELHRDGWV